MIDLAAFHFIRPLWLMLIPITFCVWWIGRRRMDALRGWRHVMDPVLLNSMVSGTTRSSARQTLLLMLWVAATISLAGPTWKPEPSPFADDPVPTVVLLRAGSSMDQDDLMPNRMERARLKVREFAELREGLPLGLAAYAGTSHLVLPPTRDTAIVATMAAEISFSIMPEDGDALVAGLLTAQQAMGERLGAIAVVTDSVSNEAITELRNALPRLKATIVFFAICNSNAPELRSVQDAAKAVGANVVVISPDDADVNQLVRLCSRRPEMVSGQDSATKWAESGYWLIPLLLLLYLPLFRRKQLSGIDS